jgi:hypothetical protein
MQNGYLGSARLPEPGSAAMQVSDGIVGAIGNTPLIALRRASAATGCTILGKARRNR